MIEEMEKAFGLRDLQVNEYSPLTLAYLGDCVYELILRTVIVNKGNAPVNKINKRASNLAKAQSQAEMITELLPELTVEELAAYKRGRNAKSYTSAKNATISDYRKATGFEALIGTLYLQKKYDRIMELVRTGLVKAGLEG